jgi:amino acid transporter
LNQILAFIKITLLVIVFFAGIARSNDHYTADWGIPPNKDASSSAIAFLHIMYSFTGWENATFVRIVKSPSRQGTNCFDRSVVKSQTTKYSGRGLYGQYSSLEFYTC